MKNPLWLYKDSYQIEIIDETNLDDNQKVLTRYQERHPYDREVGDYDQLIGIRLYENEEPIGKVLLVADTYNVLNEKGILLDNDRLLVACGYEVFCIFLPSLELLWHMQVDMATCFEIAPYQDDYITHGEVEISRLNKQGEILWQFSGKDIFVSPIERTPSFTLTPEGIELVDFNYESYLIDYDGKILQ